MTSARVAVEKAHLALRDVEVDSLVLDVSGVSFVDSSGLGGLVQVSNYAESRGVALYLSGASPRIRALLDLSGLASLLPVLDPAREN